jgi:hypothetical protein
MGPPSGHLGCTDRCALRCATLASSSPIPTHSTPTAMCLLSAISMTCSRRMASGTRPSTRWSSRHQVAASVASVPQPASHHNQQHDALSAKTRQRSARFRTAGRARGTRSPTSSRCRFSTKRPPARSAATLRACSDARGCKAVTPFGAWLSADPGVSGRQVGSRRWREAGRKPGAHDNANGGLKEPRIPVVRGFLTAKPSVAHARPLRRDASASGR